MYHEKNHFCRTVYQFSGSLCTGYAWTATPTSSGRSGTSAASLVNGRQLMVDGCQKKATIDLIGIGLTV